MHCIVGVDASAVPPTTPLRGSTAGSGGASAGTKRTKKVKTDENGVSRTIPSTPPLPPITPRGKENTGKHHMFLSH